MKWSTKKAEDFYYINKWGKDNFTVDDNGNLCALPNNTTHNHPKIKIIDIINEVKEKNIQLPIVLRFHDILRNQVKKLNESFNRAIKEASYQGEYFGVFPVKVNQMREVIEEIVDAGTEYNYGLEAGSKAELLAALAFNTNENSLTIVNGHKDETLLKLALLGDKIDKKVIIVIEKFSELPHVLKLSKKLNVKPRLGIRAKLESKGTGKWADSGGSKAKFGLSTTEIINSVKLLQENNMIDCLNLFHFHIGSQVTNIQSIKEALTEATRIYSQLYKMGAQITYFDVGGGLAVNYQGFSSMDTHSSMNYQLDDYVRDVVYTIKEISELEQVPAPHIVSESGRAIAANHSCVIVNIFGKIDPAHNDFDLSVNQDKEHHLVKNFRDIVNEMNIENIQESLNDIIQRNEEAFSSFKLGILSLEDKAKTETLYWNGLKKIYELSKDKEDIPASIVNFHSNLVTQYLCNFSIFQSLADCWAIDQILPAVPIHRLNEEPTIPAILVDITCDSDGKISQFISEETISDHIHLHPLKESEPYYIGFFLTGAYQDIMGDNHNLFGRLNEVHVYCDDDDPDDYYIEEIVSGDTTGSILSDLQYNTKQMASTIKKEVDKKILEGKIRPRIGVELTDFYEQCLSDYTYLK